MKICSFKKDSNHKCSTILKLNFKDMFQDVTKGINVFQYHTELLKTSKLETVFTFRAVVQKLLF